MSQSLSVDLRVQALQAIAEGMSGRQAGVRFGVSAASTSRWRNLELRQGDAKPGPLGGDRRFGRIEAHAALVLELVDAFADKSIEELRMRLAEHDVTIGFGGSLREIGSQSKKTAHASDQDRPDILNRRQDWFDGQLDLDPERLVFIDETVFKRGIRPPFSG